MNGFLADITLSTRLPPPATAQMRGGLAGGEPAVSAAASAATPATSVTRAFYAVQDGLTGLKTRPSPAYCVFARMMMRATTRASSTSAAIFQAL